MVPKRLFFTKGTGRHKERLTSFELALRDAGIAAQNLVRVSSIFPPNAKLRPRKEGVEFLSPGEVVFAVVAENSTREPHRLVASSIGRRHSDRPQHLRLPDRAPQLRRDRGAGREYAEELAAEMLATTLDVDFDPDKSWDEKKEIYRYRTRLFARANVTQSAIGDKMRPLDDRDRRGDPDLRVARSLDEKPEARAIQSRAFRLRAASRAIEDFENKMPTASEIPHRPGADVLLAGPDANLDKAADRVREAARAGARVICLPELFRAQYFCQREDIALFDLAEPIPGPRRNGWPPWRAKSMWS